jgi:hypothetical protein
LRWGSYPFEGQVEKILARVDGDDDLQHWEKSSYTRSLYLDLAELVVRAAVKWQDECGRLIDPYERAEPPTGTARLVSAAAGLIGAGRCRDLVPTVARGFDSAVEAMLSSQGAPGRLPGADFYMKELAWAYRHLQPYVPEAQRSHWQQSLSQCTPEGNYTDLIKPGKSTVHNFNVYALTGEFLRASYGLGDMEASTRFVDEYLPHQFGYFTSYGMYRDPNDPITYDLTVRQNLSLLLEAGYAGPLRDDVDELLRRGALTMLLYVCPNGQAPYGGRSNQHHHMEGMITCISEWEARRYAAMGRADLAGAFKRLARQSVASTMRWWHESPFKDLKNSFDPVTHHGREQYGEYSVYALLAASLFGVAYHLSDETIAERPMPAEIGGYVLELPDAFHKVFATSGGYHVEIDTGADLSYDATGLGRLVRKDFPAELGLSMPLCGTPRYTVVPVDGYHAAIGPVWKSADGKWHSLAEHSNAVATVNAVHTDKDDLRFTVCWQGTMAGCTAVEQQYRLSSEGLMVTCSVQRETPGEVGFVIPLIVSNGACVHGLLQEERGFVVSGQGACYAVRCIAPKEISLSLFRDSPDSRRVHRGANRNGVYHLGLFASSVCDQPFRLMFMFERI